MNMNFKRKLPIPMDIKEEYPVSSELSNERSRFVSELKDILSGKSNKFLLIIGPCSADNSESVLEYLERLSKVRDKVSDKIFILPRVYTNKPRTSGVGYMGMLHQPDPSVSPDMLKGIISIREILLKAYEYSGFFCADELLYPENHRYFSDLLAYVAVGARSCENQFHRLAASGLDIPTGFKNPMSGDISVLLNSISASQMEHTFIYRGWEVESRGNAYSHAILRGYVDNTGRSVPNYRLCDIKALYESYSERNLKNPALIIDTNHSNSGKDYLEQISISKEVVGYLKKEPCLSKFMKGLMIESYLEDGSQSEKGNEFGKSITDPCLGWDKTERLIYDLAELL